MQVEMDAAFRTHDVGEICFELLYRMVDIGDTAYPAPCGTESGTETHIKKAVCVRLPFLMDIFFDLPACPPFRRSCLRSASHPSRRYRQSR